MTRRMTATEVKGKILRLLDEVAAGEEIEITKRGRTVARLVPATGPRGREGTTRGCRDERVRRRSAVHHQHAVETRVTTVLL